MRNCTNCERPDRYLEIVADMELCESCMESYIAESAADDLVER